MANLFESVQLGSLVLANRVFMAPLTRSRAAADGVSFTVVRGFDGSTGIGPARKRNSVTLSS